MIDLAQEVATFAQWWSEADALLIGAGAGLSAAAGIDYSDPEDFARVFPVLARRGFRARHQLIGYQRWSQAEHWAYWATHVNDIRFGPRPHPVYARLRELCAGKDSFVLTSNVDAMFERNGFDTQRIFTPQGDYATMQCRKPCRQEVWPSQPAVELALRHLDAATFKLTAPDAIPRCPTCGGEVFMNVRIDRAFIEVPYRAQAERLNAWLSQVSRKRLLLVDIGSGFNTPTVVRWQLERLALALPHARLARINRDDAETGEVPADRALPIVRDAGEAIAVIWKACLG